MDSPKASSTENSEANVESIEVESIAVEKISGINTKTAGIKKHFWLFGPAIGFISAVIVTLVIVIWEWLENPGGIFHDQSGTHWQFVYETAISWFTPTLITIAIIASTAHLLVSMTKKLLSARI